jgi:plasmid stability protein
MASITIRNLDDDLKMRLRVEAAQHGRSMEEEARVILRCALGRAAPKPDLAKAIQNLFAPFGGVELPAIARDPGREPPDFSQ